MFVNILIFAYTSLLGYLCSLFGAYSMDVSATSFFGMKIDSQKDPNNLFVKYAKEGFAMGFFNLKILVGRKSHFSSAFLHTLIFDITQHEFSKFNIVFSSKFHYIPYTSRDVILEEKQWST